MNNDKKLTLKRIIIFILIAFVPLIIIVLIANALLGEPVYVNTTSRALSTAQLLGTIGMMFPAVANIITRMVTKEGFKNSYLQINLKGKLKYYILAVLVPLGYAVTDTILTILYYSNEYGFENVVNPDNAFITTGFTLLNISMIFYFFIPFFGEEFGWRAYLTPKLTELMPEPVAVLVSGIIWGLWHAPLTCSGHNFGVDYPFYPFAGILKMCIFCALMSSFLTLITKRTGSVFPATLAHGTNNQTSGIIFALMTTEEFMEKTSGDNVSFLLVSLLVVGIISYIILIRDYMKEKKEA